MRLQGSNNWGWPVSATREGSAPAVAAQPQTTRPTYTAPAAPSAPRTPAAALTVDHVATSRRFDDVKGAVDKTSTFAAGDPVICSFFGHGLKVGSEVVALWKDPSGTVIKKTKYVCSKPGDHPAGFMAKPPDGAWAPGAYAIDIVVNDETVQSVTFNVQGAVAAHALPTGPRPASGPALLITEPAAAEGVRDLVVVPSAAGGAVRVAGIAWDEAGVAKVVIRGQEADLREAGSEGGGRPNAVRFSAEVLLKPGRNEVDIRDVNVHGVASSRRVAFARRDEHHETHAEVAKARGQGRRFALLIGIARYKNEDIPPLRYTLNDVESIRQVLVDPKGGRFPAANVRVLTDATAQKPTMEAIGEAFNWLAGSADRPEDTVFVYFSGHGATKQKDSYLLTWETNPATLLATAMNYEIFNKFITGIPAQKKIIMLDACHSGGVSLAQRAAGEGANAELVRQLSQEAEGEGRLLSCKDEESSWEDKDLQHGVFSYFLVKGMQGEADRDHDGIVTYSELEEYVTTRVRQHTVTRMGHAQTPIHEARLTGPVIVTDKGR